MTASGAGHLGPKEDNKAALPTGYSSGRAMNNAHEQAPGEKPFDPSACPSPFRAKLMQIVTRGDDISCSELGKVPMLLALARSARLPAQRKAIVMVSSASLVRERTQVCCLP
jgi:hypothetical protein